MVSPEVQNPMSVLQPESEPMSVLQPQSEPAIFLRTALRHRLADSSREK